MLQVHQQGALTAGWQLQPRNALRGFMQNARTSFAQQLQAAHANSSYSLAYSPRPAATSMHLISAQLDACNSIPALFANAAGAVSRHRHTVVCADKLMHG